MTPTFTPAPATAPDPHTVQRIRELALELIGTERGRDRWLAHPNPDLEGQSPNDLVTAGRAAEVERYIGANLQGHGG